MTTTVPRPQRVLVIGWGFLGEAIGVRLLEAGLEVIGLTSRPTPRSEASAARGVEMVYGRAGDSGTLDALLHRVDHVVYTAGGLLPVEAAEEPTQDATATLLPWIETLEAIRRRPHIGATLVASGGTAYGNPTRVPVCETDTVAPVSAYGASRQACALYAETYARTYGLRIQVARCANVYGPGQPYDRSQGAVAVFLHRLMNGIPITVFGDGSAVRDYVAVDDVAHAIQRLVQDRIPVDVVNIGTGRGHTTLEVLDTLVAITELPAVVSFAPERKHDARAVVLDISRLRSLIDYNPVPLLSGLQLLWDAVAEEAFPLAPSA